MMATISKDFTFSASHQLGSLPHGHQCARLHGHNYIIRVGIEGEVDHRGFVVDYGDLAGFGRYVDRSLDHRHLNEVVDQPTAERIAYHLVGILRKEVTPLCSNGHHPLAISIAVSETPKTWATITEKW